MKIVVLAGGLSAERDVSLSSSAKICQALRENGHQAVVVDMFLGVEQPLADADKDAFFANAQPASYTVSKQAPDIAAIKALRTDKSPCRFGPQVLELCRAADIVFIGLHGEDGEDGKVQAAFELFGIKYTGSGSLASALAMDKALAKIVFNAAGLQTPGGVTLEKGQPRPVLPPLPLVIKPCCGGSSVATALVEEEGQLEAAIAAAFACDDKVLAEQYIKGREIQVALLGQQALPPIELDYSSKFFDYEVKYQAGACREICPAPIDDATTQRIQQAGLLAYNALGLEVYSRADFILTAEGELFLLEINTLPGMTATSLVPQEAAAAGIGYNELCQRIIELSLQRFA